jgi:hypothetical protein
MIQTVIGLLAVLGAVTTLASVPLHDGGGSDLVRSHRAVFTLPDGWTRYRTVSTGTVTSDTYVTGLRAPGGLTCRVLLSTRAALRHAPPERDFDVQERGRAGTLRWYLGLEEGALRAVAQRRAPLSLRTARRLYTGYEMTLRAESPGTVCDDAALKQRAALRLAMRSIRLRRRS